MALQFQPSYRPGGNFLGQVLGGDGISGENVDPSQDPASMAGWADQSLGDPGSGMPTMNAPALPPPDHSGRRSVLDMIGGLGDVFATVGGSTAQYQPQLDARAARAQLQKNNDFENASHPLQLQAAQEKLDDHHRAILGAAVNGLSSVLGDGGPEGQAKLAAAFPVVASHLGMSPEEQQQLWGEIQKDPKGVLSALDDSINTKTPKGAASSEVQNYNLLKEHNPALAEKYLSSLVDGKPLSAKDRMSLAVQMQRLTIDGKKADAYVAEHTPSTAGGAGGAGGLTPQGLDYAANIYRAEGKLPPLGQGKAAAATRTAIINRAEELGRGTGDVHDNPAAYHADFKANAAGLRDLTVRSSKILASEETANRNADQVLSTMGKGAGNTGVPLFNAWQNRASTKFQNNPDVGKFNTAVQTFANEYAAVVSGGAGANAPTTVHAQVEATKMINSAQTPEILRGVIDQMRIEMQNRRNGFARQAGELRNGMRLPGAHHPGTPAGDVPVMTPDQVRAAPKGTRFRTVDGRILVRQ